MTVTCLVLAKEVSVVKKNQKEISGRGIFGYNWIFSWVSLISVKWGKPSLKVFIILLFPVVPNVKPTYRKSWAVNLFKVVGFDLAPLLQGQSRVVKLKCADNLPLMILQVWIVKPMKRQPWPWSLSI